MPAALKKSLFVSSGAAKAQTKNKEASHKTAKEAEKDEENYCKCASIRIYGTQPEVIVENEKLALEMWF